MKKLALAGLVMTAALGLGGCGGGKSDAKHLTIAGSTAFAPVAEKLSAAFKAKNPGLKIDIQAQGSGMGVKSAKEGSSDIGMGDFAELPPAAAELKGVVVSRDAIAVVVHPSNPVKNLTMEQVSKVFKGEITNWKDVGGADKPIVVVCREPGSGTRTSFEQCLKIRIGDKAQQQSSNGACRESVASNADAVTCISLVHVDAKVAAISIDGVAPSIPNVKSGSYKIAASDYLLTKGDPQGLAKEFIDFVLSPEGQKIIESAGLAPAR